MGDNAPMHPFHYLLAAFAFVGLAALGALMRWERRYFAARGKAGAWLRVRLATLPIAALTALLVIVPARSSSGMEGLAVFYILLFTAAPAFWFGAHWLAGRLTVPALRASESFLVAVSPLLLLYIVSMLAHTLQAPAWIALRALGWA